MSIVESIESGNLPPELREALRTLLSQRGLPYLDIPGTDGPSICVGTSLANMRRHIEAEYEERLGTHPKVPAHYSISGRRKLPDVRPQCRDMATQTEGLPEMSMPLQPGLGSTATPTRRRQDTPTGTQIESAPEAGMRRRKGRGKPFVSRAFCSSSSDTDQQAPAPSPPRSHRHPSQGLLPYSYLRPSY